MIRNCESCTLSIQNLCLKLERFKSKKRPNWRKLWHSNNHIDLPHCANYLKPTTNYGAYVLSTSSNNTMYMSLWWPLLTNHLSIYLHSNILAQLTRFGFTHELATMIEVKHPSLIHANTSGRCHLSLSLPPLLKYRHPMKKGDHVNPTHLNNGGNILNSCIKLDTITAIPYKQLLYMATVT